MSRRCRPFDHRAPRYGPCSPASRPRHPSDSEAADPPKFIDLSDATSCRDPNDQLLVAHDRAVQYSRKVLRHRLDEGGRERREVAASW